MRPADFLNEPRHQLQGQLAGLQVLCWSQHAAGDIPSCNERVLQAINDNLHPLRTDTLALDGIWLVQSDVAIGMR